MSLRSQPLDRCFAIYVGIVCCYFVISHIFEWLIVQENFATYFLNWKRRCYTWHYAHMFLAHLHIIFGISIFQVHHIHLPLPCVFFNKFKEFITISNQVKSHAKIGYLPFSTKIILVTMIIGVGIGELRIGSNNMVVILTIMKTFHVKIALKHEKVFFFNLWFFWI
jgi:hypothetical protein